MIFSPFCNSVVVNIYYGVLIPTWAQPAVELPGVKRAGNRWAPRPSCGLPELSPRTDPSTSSGMSKFNLSRGRGKLSIQATYPPTKYIFISHYTYIFLNLISSCFQRTFAQIRWLPTTVWDFPHSDKLAWRLFFEREAIDLMIHMSCSFNQRRCGELLRVSVSDDKVRCQSAQLSLFRVVVWFIHNSTRTYQNAKPLDTVFRVKSAIFDEATISVFRVELPS